jgi:hypothetical protein
LYCIHPPTPFPAPPNTPLSRNCSTLLFSHFVEEKTYGIIKSLQTWKMSKIQNVWASYSYFIISYGSWEFDGYLLRQPMLM